MDFFNYTDQTLFAENVSLETVAEQFGTPTYVYSRATFERHYNAYADAFASHPTLVCYAVKACSNIAILNVLAKLGAGFDIVSIGELERVVRAGGDPSKVMFSGLGKQEHEMRRALELGIHCFNVESEPELYRLNKVAGELGVKAPVSMRVNPDVDAKTHPYISTGLKENKFGIDIKDAPRIYQVANEMAHLNVMGVDCHIGSQLTELKPFLDTFDRLITLIDELAGLGIEIKHMDLGGGLGVRYRDEVPPEPADYAQLILDKMKGRDISLAFEPGRSIAANAGLLLTKVEFLKCTEHKNFAVIDGAMNDLIRPSLYSAWMNIVPVNLEATSEGKRIYDLVGPVCETGDFLGKDRELDIQAGDLLAVRSAGAYGFTMASNYNSRNRAAEVMVDGDVAHLIREREDIDHQLAGEQLLPE
ncbi:diaminopimelate decarboxylase [Marinomonas mediterranea]|uniref:Diaminopimelate decarboxylase n=1 Tax=Marinomonas mediterranea (strain ATCC 700492 / JCM 21426 / NBRC 103028 / MMB-1) TaxID=717774 RepID=F2K0S9_MARM1|nr:diaminopimelate decarboxylase [Marinomonas mediterranea]ADZ92171.1 diaminopimelate decarboxylase [Marinomonas mediterranea MMB-1]WCN10132.1 diaminopimelate decarboxylase [Marinomonas mediterranea]WCN14177.1 diaminopimelate decarboxylase [Marinomonas mediterranea]WCN18233.1 diaminopimelate decarboxylase [Marinomonas mediterranea MMB-1]